MSIKTAIILAAGKGERLRNITGNEFPKPLTPVGNIPIIEYSIHALIHAGVERILLGCGHLLESFTYLEKKFEQVSVVENPKYDEHASIFTFLLFEPLVKQAFYLLEADIIYDPLILSDMLNEKELQNTILTSSPLQLDDNVYYKSEKGVLTQLSKQTDEKKAEGVMTGIWAFSDGFLQRFNQYGNDKKIDFSEDYEILLSQYSAEQEAIQVYHSPNLTWCEIDNETHLEYAETNVLPEIEHKFKSIPGFQK